MRENRRSRVFYVSKVGMFLKEQMIFLMLCMMTMISLSGCVEKNTDKQEMICDEKTVEAEHIVMTYQTMDYSVLDDVKEVLEAINEITIPEIGVEVEFKFVDARDAYSEYSLWIGNGKHVDLMIMNNQDITTYINRNMLLPIDDLLETYAPDIAGFMKEEGYSLTEGSIVNGEAYGFTIISELLGSGGGLWIPLRYVEEAGLAYEKEHIYSLKELDVLFAELKELYPDKYPLGQITSGNNFSTLGYYDSVGNGLGTDATLGTLMEGDTEIENFFETENYKEFLEYLRSWYLKGYIYSDAAITDAENIDFVKEGIVLSWPFASTPGLVSESNFGEKIVCLRTTEVTLGAAHTKLGFWAIPITSTNPEAAMRFMNLMYKDNRIANLIQWGIEGVHYVLKDAENGLIEYPEGENAQTVGYYNPLNLYGDRRKVYSMETAELRQEYKDYSEEALNNPKEIRSFQYSSFNMAAEIDAVQEVIEKYVPVLESGSVDLEIYYPQFLEELEKAGMSEIIADKQAQYDAWVEAEK